MLFNSFDFVFFFLPITWALYLLLRLRIIFCAKDAGCFTGSSTLQDTHRPFAHLKKFYPIVKDELASAFLCADLNITPEVREDHASYIADWLTVLQNDKRAIFTAAAHAQKAADYLHGSKSGKEAHAGI